MPFPSNSDARKLPYPLNYSEVYTSLAGDNEQIVNPFSWPSNDPDERVYIVLGLSQNEYTALASAVDAGSDIAYGDDAQKIWWIWVRAFMVASFCEQVDDCITNNPTTITAINNTIINQGDVNPNSIDPDNTTGGDRVPDAETASIATPPPGCDKDALWAGIREMVERIDQNGRDVLEDLQFINDKIEMWGEIIDLVPLLGDTIKDIGDLFTAQIPDLLNAYNSASSPTFLDNVACDLFEMVCNECRYPTFDEVFNYFGSLSYFSLPTFTTMTYGGLWDLIKTVSGAIPESLWYSINVWQCFTLGIGGTFKRSYGSKTFEIWASFGEDNPNNNWELLCDGCGATWGYQWEGTTLLNDWTIVSGNGVWDTDHYEGVYAANALWIILNIAVPYPIDITHIEFDVDGNCTRASGGDGSDVIVDNQLKHHTGISVGAFDYTEGWTAPMPSSINVQCKLVVAANSAIDGSFSNLTRIQILGTGTDPNWNGTPI